jgi:Flp pilus assembly protein TadD
MEQKQQLQLALDAKNSEIKNIKETVNDLKNVADSNNEYNIEDDPKYKELMEQQKQLQLALDAKNSEIKNIKETVNELKNELKSRETQIASLKDSSSANSDIKNTPEYIALMNENDQLQTMLNDKSKSIESLKKSVGDLESENATLVNLKHSYEAEKERKQSEEAENEKAHEEIWKLIEAASEAEKNGKTDAATWYYETILEQDHENPTALSKLGLMKASIGNFSDAEPLLKKAVEKDPKNLEALLALTFCYISNKKYYKALSMAALANTVNSNNATVHRYMGIICSYLGWYDVAETEFRKAFRINPKSGETAYNATVNLIKADISKIKIAKQWYDKAIELGIEKDLVLEKLFQKKLKEFADSDKKKHSKLRKTHSSKKMSKSK